MAAELQQLLSDLQRNPAFQDAAALQRIAARLQVELNAPQASRPQAAPPVCLTPLQRQTWEAMQAFLALLCEYAGWTNRTEWLQLLDVAADLLSRGPQGDTPYIKDGTWWIGEEDTGVYASGQPPTISPGGTWVVDGVDTGVTAVGKDGAPGATGATGPQGAQGIPGQGLIVQGQFNTPGDLIAAHPTANVGDAFLVGVTDPKSLYIWFSGAWHDVGPLTGVGISDAPNTATQPYARDGLTQNWVLVTHDGGSFP